MATSGTYSFIVTRDQIIAKALRILQVYGTGDVVPAADITNCSEALNIVTKSMVMEGLPLECVLDISVPTVANQSQYTLGPSNISSPLRPLRILYAYIRNSQGNDVEMKIVSRYDYDTLGQKTSQGVPNQIFYDPQLTDGFVTVYNVPTDNTYTMHFVIQRQYQDFNNAADNPDFPQAAYQMLAWTLADEISLEYECKMDIVEKVAIKAKALREKYFAFEQEQASVMFTPSERRY